MSVLTPKCSVGDRITQDDHEERLAGKILDQMKKDVEDMGHKPQPLKCEPPLTDAGEELGVHFDNGFPFKAKLANAPVRPGSVRLVIRDVDFQHPIYDNGKGHLCGTRHLNGTINYSSGEVTLFISPKADNKMITAQYATDFVAADDLETGHADGIFKRIVTHFKTRR